jgi:hypothetical protein
MTFWDFVNGLIANDQVRILVGLIVGNLALGVAAAIANPKQKFDLTRVGDYARTRVVPILAVYSVGALVSWAAPLDPILGHLRDLIFTTEMAVLVGLLLANLRDLGVSIPSTLAGPLASQEPTVTVGPGIRIQNQGNAGITGSPSITVPPGK